MNVREKEEGDGALPANPVQVWGLESLLVPPRCFAPGARIAGGSALPLSERAERETSRLRQGGRNRRSLASRRQARRGLVDTDGGSGLDGVRAQHGTRRPKLFALQCAATGGPAHETANERSGSSGLGGLQNRPRRTVQWLAAATILAFGRREESSALFAP